MVGSRSPEITSTKVEASEWTKKAPFWECKAPWYIFLSLPSISKHKSMVPYWNLHKLPKLFTAQKISQQNHPKMSHHSPQQNSRFQSSTSNFSRNLDSSQSALSGCRSTEIRRLRVLQGQIHWTKSSNMCQALTTIAIHLRSHKMACDESYEVRWIFCRLISKCIETYWKKHMFKKASTYTYVYIYMYICGYVQTNNEQMKYTDSYVLQFFLGVYPNPFSIIHRSPKNPRYTKFTCHILGLQLQTTLRSCDTLPETNSSWKWAKKPTKGKIVFQPSIFRSYVILFAHFEKMLFEEKSYQRR